MSEVKTAAGAEGYVECTAYKRDVKCYFTEKASPEIRDIIVHVRRQFPNPHQKVLLKTDMTLPEKDLLDQLIFVDGVNNAKIGEVLGVTNTSFLCVEVSEEKRNVPGFGLQEAIMEFTQVYGMTSFEILVYGEETEMVTELWEYLQSIGSLPYKVIFPASATKRLKLFENGIDIAPYAERLDVAAQRNNLTTGFLNSVMDELREQVKAGKTAIQDFEDTRSTYAKWLTLCLIDEFSLPPVYLTPYIAEYVAYNIAYPFEKLSLFERIKFVSKLPQSVGYIGRNQELLCLYHIAQKVYPTPALAFDLTTGEVITEGLEDFVMQKLSIQDYRTRFPGSRTYFTQGATGLSQATGGDADVDTQLTQVFANMSMNPATDGAYLTIRNTVMAKFAGRNYVLYYNEPLGLVGALQSEYFGNHPMVVKEEDFSRLIDAKVVLAAQHRDSAATASQGRSAFTEIMVRAASTFKTAIPVYVLMCSEITSLYATELSYYDQRLRCDKNVVPIVTHADSELKRKRTLFDFIKLNNVVGDKIASRAITAFGTINASNGYVNSLPVSIDTFRGCKLL